MAPSFNSDNVATELPLGSRRRNRPSRGLSNPSLPHALPEAAVYRVVKSRHHPSGQFNRKIQVLRFQRRFVKSIDAGKQKSIGFEQLHVVVFAIPPAVKKRFGLFVPKLSSDKCHIPFRRRAIFFTPKTTDARAKAPSIRPFHDARILSSRCGRTRVDALNEHFLLCAASEHSDQSRCPASHLPGWDSPRSRHFGRRAAVDGCGQRNSPRP